MDLSFKKTIGNLPEPKTYVFVVKIWMEDYDEDTREVVWRGYLKDLLNQEKETYFKSLSDLNGLMKSYLNKLGVTEVE
jgi:hypothetical protein